jgi:hypothetical protein
LSPSHCALMACGKPDILAELAQSSHMSAGLSFQTWAGRRRGGRHTKTSPDRSGQHGAQRVRKTSTNLAGDGILLNQRLAGKVKLQGIICSTSTQAAIRTPAVGCLPQFKRCAHRSRARRSCPCKRSPGTDSDRLQGSRHSARVTARCAGAATGTALTLQEEGIVAQRGDAQPNLAEVVEVLQRRCLPSKATRPT